MSVASERAVAPFYIRWFDGHAASPAVDPIEAEKIDWVRVMPFVAMHLGCALVIWVGFSWAALGVAVGLYLLRMFVITGFYHRYFSHRTFKTSRWLQFAMGFVGCTAAQRGPMWWAGHHRHHHIHSEEPPDRHSPVQHGFLWSHMLWFLNKSSVVTPMEKVRDWGKFPELVFLDRFDWLPVILFGGAMWGLGWGLGWAFPGLHTSGWQMFVWAFFVSTVVVYHATYTINSLAHQFGSRRFATTDDSRNNFWLALLTLGEGWHNNHHHYPAAIQQGFYWWEIDITYYVLWMMKQVGLVWDLRHVPEEALHRRREGASGDAVARAGATIVAPRGEASA
jgi:stearoyl-CoA desaturase (delta-9 desaturase)